MFQCLSYFSPSVSETGTEEGQGKIRESGGDSAKLWRHLGSLGYGESKNKSSTVLEQDGVKYFDAENVVKVFNEYFTKVASKLVDLLPIPTGVYSTASATFANFYRRRGIFGPRFTLSPVSRHFILTQLYLFNPKKR